VASYVCQLREFARFCLSLVLIPPFAWLRWLLLLFSSVWLARKTYYARKSLNIKETGNVTVTFQNRP